MKTYEKFILSNLYTRKRKLNPKIIELGNSLVAFIKSILKDKWQISNHLWYPEDNKNQPVWSIFAYPYDLGSTIRFIGLYGQSENSVGIALLKNRSEDLDRILIFLELVLTDDYITKHLSSDPFYKVPLDKIDNIIKELTLENFDLYINANKYNL
jgi:hypothetical protein